MKTHQKRIFKLWLLVFMVFLFLSGSAAAKSIEISLSLIIPPGHMRNIHVLDPWVKMVRDRTEKKVKITPYYGAALASPDETFEFTLNGVADIAEGITYATPGRFPLTETVMLPELGFETSLSCSKALWQIYEESPELKKEYAGVKVLWLHVTPAVKLVTRKKPVYSLEDLKGLKIWVSGATAVKMGKALGFTPVSMPVGDLYLSLEKGVIDGAALPVEILISRRLAEVTKYVIDIDLGHDTFYVIMNKDTWKRLSPDVQKVFEELSAEWAVDFTGKAWDKFDTEAQERVISMGIEFISLSDAEKTKWKELLGQVKNEYAAELDARNMPGTKLLNKLEALGRE